MEKRVDFKSWDEVWAGKRNGSGLGMTMADAGLYLAAKEISNVLIFITIVR